jgi:hypothetical protein
MIGSDYVANAHLPDGRIISVWRRGAAVAFFALARALHRETMSGCFDA